MNNKKFAQTIAYLLKVILVALAYIALINKDYLWTLFAITMIFISFIPSLIRRFSKIRFLYLLDIFVVLALIFHMGNGIYDVSSYFPMFNKFTHFFSALVVAFLVLTFLPIIDEDFKKNKSVFLFDVVTTTMAFGVIWEFLEWGADNFFGLNTQPGLNDTMGDLFADTLGALLIALIGWFLIETKAFKKMIKDIKKEFE